MLLLLRHGNTFEPTQTPVWVGARTDLPLTAEGEAQARAAGQFIAARFGALADIAAGPLWRTRRAAEIVMQEMAMEETLSVDSRLREIDYGLWEARSSEEIRAQYGAETLEAWEQRGLWPEGMRWQPESAELQASLRDFLAEQHALLSAKTTPHLAVTSNGVLRLIHALVTGTPAGPAAKVKTGHLCILQPDGAGWRVEGWNLKPVA